MRILHLPEPAAHYIVLTVPPTIVDILDPGQLEETGSPSMAIPQAWIALAQGPLTQMAQESLLWCVQAQKALFTPRPLV